MSKTPRQFECRDDIWKRVEALASRRGVSTDEIVQAALVQLFSRKKPTQPPSEQATKAPRPAPPGRPPAPRPAPPPGSGTPVRPAPKRPPPPSGRSLPRPGGARPRPTPAPAAAPTLFMWVEGSWYAIDQDEFVLGRGSKYSDVAIRDANISRRHAAIVRRDGRYYMTDLGSTNGVEFNGVRVDNHEIREGTQYFLCDHELRFTFNAPA